ncbi:hypothetical protein [Halospeciosus flavus]|uniref:Uncharacterized protein n=1 Tax=Halospeciosus flavus TaxID=3032283 RepID=A0ABD5Z7Z8_9EURY|nr:hypothetical protein [Halospeciosus flavus]
MLEAFLGVLVLVGALAVAGQPSFGRGDLQLARFGGGVALLTAAIAGGRAAGDGLTSLGGGVQHVLLLAAILGVLGGLGLVLDAMEATAR